MVLTDEQWRLRLLTAVARGQRFGFDDYTADRNIVDEHEAQYGVWGECDMCPAGSAHHFVKVTEVGHPNPDTLKLCHDHRQPYFPSRQPIDGDLDQAAYDRYLEARERAAEDDRRVA